MLGFLVCVSLSLVFPEVAGRSMPLGAAYAVRTGVGAVGTPVIGFVRFDEPATMVRAL